MRLKQLITYFVLAYSISWLIWLPLYGHIWGLNNLPILPFHHALGGLGPLIASFLTTWIYNKQEGIKHLLAKCFRLKPLIYLLVALLSPFLLALVAMVINYAVYNIPIDFSTILTSREFPEFNLGTFFMYNLVFFGFGEEAGWRGFALPRLQEKYSGLASAIILTVFWALWHWPLFFYRPGYTSMDAGGIFGWVLSLLTGSVLLSWLYNSSRGSILICAVFHSTIDIVFTADFANKNIINYMGALITIWGILTIIIFKPRNLSANKSESDGI